MNNRRAFILGLTGIASSRGGRSAQDQEKNPALPPRMVPRAGGGGEQHAALGTHCWSGKCVEKMSPVWYPAASLPGFAGEPLKLDFASLGSLRRLTYSIWPYAENTQPGPPNWSAKPSACPNFDEILDFPASPASPPSPLQQGPYVIDVFAEARPGRRHVPGIQTARRTGALRGHADSRAGVRRRSRLGDGQATNRAASLHWAPGRCLVGRASGTDPGLLVREQRHPADGHRVCRQSRRSARRRVDSAAAALYDQGVNGSTVALVAVELMWQGPKRPFFFVVGGTGQGDCRLHFVPGATYLIQTRHDGYGPLDTNTCGGSRQMDAAIS